MVKSRFLRNKCCLVYLDRVEVCLFSLEGVGYYYIKYMFSVTNGVVETVP